MLNSSSYICSYFCFVSLLKVYLRVMKPLMKSPFWILLLSFSFLFCSPAQAQLEKVEEPKAASPEESYSVPSFLNIKDLAVPKTLGKIEDRFTGKSPRWVIHIQDVHAHFTAQENIAAIVDHLNAVYGIKTVALEGGWGQTSFPLSWGLPNSKEKQMLARALLEEDYLTGPAHAALFSQTPISLVGIEDANLYEENREIYVRHLAERENVSAKVEASQKKISQSKTAVFQPELLSFDKSLIDFREGKKADKFLPSLFQTAEVKGVDLSSLDQVMLFKEVIAKEKALSKEKLDSEAARLMQGFKRTRLSFEELLRSGKIAADKLELYPEAKKYLEVMKLQDGIFHREFFHQIDEAVLRLKEKLFSSEEEKILDAKSERFLLAKRIILFQATPDDLNAYESQKTEIDADMDAEGLGESLNLALSFYEIAKKRDEIFFQKVTSDERLQGDVAIVTGGFHTEALSEQMKQAGISYIVVTPDLANEAPNDQLYFQRLQENMVSMQTLSALRNLIFITTPEDPETTVFDIAFPQAVNRVKETKNILEGVDMIKSPFYGEGAQLMAPAGRTAGLTGAAKSISEEEFTNLDPAKRLETFKAWLDSDEKSDLPILLVLAGKDLTYSLQDELNRQTVEAFKQNPNNSAVVLGTDFPTDILGGKARIFIESGAETIEAYMELPAAIRRLKQVENRAAGIEGETLKKQPILVFPVKVKGELLRGILIVAAAAARGEIRFSENPAAHDRFWSAVQELLAQFPTLEAIRTAA